MSSYNFSDPTVRVLLTTGFFGNGNPESFIQPTSSIQEYLTKQDPAVVAIIARSIATTHGRVEAIHAALGDKANERLDMVRRLFQHQTNIQYISPEIREVFSIAIARIDGILGSHSNQ